MQICQDGCQGSLSAESGILTALSYTVSLKASVLLPNICSSDFRCTSSLCSPCTYLSPVFPSTSSVPAGLLGLSSCKPVEGTVRTIFHTWVFGSASACQSACPWPSLPHLFFLAHHPLFPQQSARTSFSHCGVCAQIRSLLFTWVAHFSSFFPFFLAFWTPLHFGQFSLRFTVFNSSVLIAVADF